MADPYNAGGLLLVGCKNQSDFGLTCKEPTLSKQVELALMNAADAMKGYQFS